MTNDDEKALNRFVASGEGLIVEHPKNSNAKGVKVIFENDEVRFENIDYQKDKDTDKIKSPMK